jgi:hypothetical protein
MASPTAKDTTADLIFTLPASPTSIRLTADEPTLRIPALESTAADSRPKEGGMSARVWTWLGIAGTAGLLILAVAFNVSRTPFADEDESLRERALAYARSHLGGATIASIAKHGDPDSASTARTPPVESRGDAPRSLPAEELAARRAWPAPAARVDLFV